MLAPERRTRTDIFAAATLVGIVMVAATLVWLRADARHTESVTAAQPKDPPPAAATLPTELRELWQAPNDATHVPLTSGGAVITGTDGTVTGREPRTGNQLWHYRRNIALCGIQAQFGTVTAVFRDDRGCSQTTQLTGSDGTRRTARSSFMDDSIQLSVDGTYVLAQGPSRLEMWRSDLVRTLEYGYVDAPVNPNTQPRAGCTLLSARSAPSRLAVVERCPDETANRLTVLDPAPEDGSEPQEFGSHVLTEPDATSDHIRVLAVTNSRILLYLPGKTEGPHPIGPRLAVYDSTGNAVTSRAVTAPLTEAARTMTMGSMTVLYTGQDLIALDTSSFTPIWTVPDVLGAPAAMAGSLLVPVRAGFTALDPVDGTEVARIPVQRTDDPDSPITVAVYGDVVLEQRAGRLFALG